MRPLRAITRLWRTRRTFGRRTAVFLRFHTASDGPFTRFLEQQGESKALGKFSGIWHSPRFDNAIRYTAILNESISSAVDSLSVFDNWVSIIEKLQIHVDDPNLHTIHLRILFSEGAPKWDPKQSSLESLDPQHAIVRTVAMTLISARQIAKLDLLHHLGVECNRWDLVSWIVRVLTEKKPMDASSSTLPLYTQPPDLNFDVFQSTWPPFSVSNDELSQIISSVEQSEELGQSSRSMASFYHTSGSEVFDGIDANLQHAAIGIVLWSLGKLIMTARGAYQPVTSDTYMDHVLDILSILHHNDIIPRKTYTFDESFDQGLRQTPILADLYQPMLYAILDAEWNIFQSDIPDVAKYESIASMPLPNFQFPVHDSNPSNLLSNCHEVWFELLLWIMLRGGWHDEGTSLILEAYDACGWSAVPSTSMYKLEDGKRVWNVPSCAVSSELVASYVDLMTCFIELNWSRSAIYAFKMMLSSEENLRFCTWDNLTVRMISQHSQNLQEDERNLNRVIGLAEPETLSSASDEPIDLDVPSDSQLAYSSNPLNGLVHQTLWKDLFLSDILAAVETLLSIRSKERDATEFQFHGSNKIPEHILTALIDAVVALDPHTLGPQLLFPPVDSFSVPLLEKSDYSKPLIAKSLIRYATIVKDDRLLRDILRENRRVDMDHHPLVSIALMEAQIENQRWNATENTILSLQSSRTLRKEAWVNFAIANLAKALIKLRSRHGSEYDREATNQHVSLCSNILRRLVEQTVQYADLRQQARAEDGDLALEIRSLLAVLATIDKSWLAFCTPHITSLRSQPLILKESTFLIVLEAVADYEGFMPAWRLFTKWCQDIDQIVKGEKPLNAFDMGIYHLPMDRDVDQVSEETHFEKETKLSDDNVVEPELGEEAEHLNGGSIVPANPSDSHGESVSPWTEQTLVEPRDRVMHHFSPTNWVRVNLVSNDALDLEDLESAYSISFRGRVPVSLMIVRSLLVRAPERDMDVETAKAIEKLLLVMKWKLEGREEPEQAWNREMELIRTIKMLKSG